jgi:serpin B
MRNRFFLPGMFSLFIIAGILVAGCTQVPSPGRSVQTATTVPAPAPAPSDSNMTLITGGPSAVVDANNQFAFDLYSHIRNVPENKESNIFFSPFSMSSALAMTYEGARGKTADEIASVFHFPADNQIRRQQYYEINTRTNQNDPNYRLSTANALWAEKTYHFLPEYMQSVQHYYDANATNLDFINTPEDSRGIINRWVEGKTEGKITGLLPKGSVDTLTRLVITNALYFNGTWIMQFNQDNTHDADFAIAPDRKVRVKMMAEENSHIDFNYYENDLLQIIEMPYMYDKGKPLSMLVILPRGNNLTVVENSLNAGSLSGLRDSLKREHVFIYLPKYRIERQYDMTAALGDMGMPTTFSPFADFSGMDGTQDLFISTIVHKAYIDVNEKGTEATAATADVVELESAPWTPPKIYSFKADHPFLFIIQEKETGTILFIGRVMNPDA